MVSMPLADTRLRAHNQDTFLTVSVPFDQTRTYRAAEPLASALFDMQRGIVIGPNLEGS